MMGLCEGDGYSLWHRWEPSCVQPYLRSSRLSAEVMAAAPSLIDRVRDDLKNGIGIAETRILYRCTASGCTALKVKTLEGWWTLDDVRGTRKVEA